MLRSEIQNKTGLTRKAIEYYEERKIIKPKRSENGYRDYSEKDLEVLIKVSLYRKLGMSVPEIEKVIFSGVNSLSSILRKKEHQLDIEQKRKAILKLIIEGEKQEIIDKKIALIEMEETIYEKLERAFPGYFGQMIFSAYQPFLNEPIRKDGEKAYCEYIKYLDNLPSLDLTEEEKEYLDSITSSFDMDTLKDVNNAKIEAIADADQWIKDNEVFISHYEDFKRSEEYLRSPMKQIQDKIGKFMIDNKYYEIAIPLIRKFSESYDKYYIKLLEANDIYLNMKNKRFPV